MFFLIKEQQQQLLRLQQAAKNQLFEMEQLRVQHAPLSFAATNGSNPDYDNVDEVTQDVTALMSRMKTLTDFIHNQNDLASSLGADEKSELIEEQTQLQKKLSELKNKKQQMANLVNELQAMNVQAENNFEDSNRSTEAPIIRNSTDDEFQRIETLEHNDNNKNKNDDEEDDDDEDDEVLAAGSNIIQDKIAEINAMKDQLKRLQDMMHTVKLIEIKNGDFNPDDGVSDEANNEANNVPTNEDPQRDEEEREMAERVRALHNMTNDLRQQAGNIYFVLAKNELKLLSIIHNTPIFI